ncbi:MAG: cell division protein ZapA, partial [Betaproteobacteria bacterium]|nr:cell division protein ZapA [Betaproteobacteria bacterium]
NLAYEANDLADNATQAEPMPLTLNRRQSDVLLEPLLRRLDKVLGDDGKLF